MKQLFVHLQLTHSIIILLQCCDKIVQKNIMKIKEENGSYAATRKFLSLATKKILKSGWSHQLLQILTTLYLEELISLSKCCYFINSCLNFIQLKLTENL